MTPRLDPAQRRWIIANALIGTAIVNVVVNLGVGWLSAHGHARLPRFTASTQTSVLGDGLGALFTLPLITCVLVTVGIRRDLAHGGLARLDWAPANRVWQWVVQPRPIVRGFRLGVVAFVALALPIGIVLAVAFPHGLAHSNFVIFHVVWTVVLGAVATPIIALAAMTDETALVADAVPAEAV